MNSKNLNLLIQAEYSSFNDKYLFNNDNVRNLILIDKNNSLSIISKQDCIIIDRFELFEENSKENIIEKF